MKKIDIYEIALKIFGLFSAYSLIDYIQNLILFLFSIDKMDQIITGNNSTQIILLFTVQIILILIISFFLIFKTKLIVGKICNNQESEKFDFSNFELKNLFEIIIKTLGLILFFWNLPDLILSLIKYYELKDLYTRNDFTGNNLLILSSIKVVIGILLAKFAYKIKELI